MSDTWSAGEIVTFSKLNTATKLHDALCVAVKGTQAITDNTTTTLSWAAADFTDPRNWHDHTGGSPTNERLLPDIAGIYRAGYSLDWEDQSDYARFEVILAVGGGTVPLTLAQQYGTLGGAGGGKRMSGSFPPAISLDGVDDFVTLTVNQVNGAAASRGVTGIFFVELVHPT